jgi:hypothetical protein
MSKKTREAGSEFYSRNWKDYDEDSQLLYSYLKKKGKHKRADNQKTDKR